MCRYSIEGEKNVMSTVAAGCFFPSIEYLHMRTEKKIIILVF